MARSAKQSVTGNPDPAAASDGNASAAISNGVDSLAAGTRFTVNPAELGSGDGSATGGDGNATGEPVRKRRGRKPGSRNKTTNTPLDINGLEFILVSSHNMLAAMFTAPSLMLDKEEANQLATATANVARHYDITATEKTLDWTAFFMALGAVYGPRIMAARLNRKMAQAKAKSERTDLPAAVNGSADAGFSHIPGAMQ